MLNRSSIFALAAMAAVAVAAPTSASAMRGGFGSSGGVRSFSSVGISHTAGIAHVGTTGIGTTGGYSPGRDSFTRRFTSQSGVIKCLLCGNGSTTPPPSAPCSVYTRCGNPTGGGPNLPPPIAWWPPYHHDHPWWIKFHHPHWGVGEYDTTLVTAPVDAAATPTAPCNCLTKQYLDDGSVLFQDICTKEAALATPDELKAQAQGASPTQTQ
jgi:hypothetical protein